MYAVYFKYYQTFSILGVFSTKEEAQALVDRLKGPTCSVHIEHIANLDIFEFKFAWPRGANAPFINKISPIQEGCSDVYLFDKCTYYGTVVASCYKEAFEKIKAAKDAQ